MPDTTLTEEQEQLKRLLKRWTKYDARWCLVTAIMVLVLLEDRYLPPLLYQLYQFLGLPLMCMACYFLWRWSLQRFVGRLSKEERELLVCPAKTNVLNRSNINALVKACKIEPEKEYLRPSIEPEQTDTLLRAATPTDNTPQDQLLRPASTDEK